VEVTTLLIPGLNDETRNLAELARWIVTELGPETPWHVSRFFPTYRLTDLDPTPAETVETTVEIGRAAGLAHVYSGNLRDGDEDTHCSGCGETLIRRRGFRSMPAGLVGGSCGRCGRELGGIGLAEFGVAAAAR
jgi:pyruvate formate lyase activating enzyme